MGITGTDWRRLWSSDLEGEGPKNHVCWIRSVANGGIVITIVTIESWGGPV